MSCMRCGRNTANGQVFCEQCQESMTRYPVKSDAPIHLPVHKPRDPGAKPVRRKKELSAEEMVPLLQKKIRRLLLALIVTLLALALLLSGFIYTLMKPAPQEQEKIGQNYQTVETASSNIFTVSGE